MYEANSVHVMLSKYIHRLKTRASHLYSLYSAHTVLVTLSIHLSHFLAFTRVLFPFHDTIRYENDTMCILYAVQWKGFVCALCVENERYYREVYRIKYIDRLCIYNNIHFFFVVDGESLLVIGYTIESNVCASVCSLCRERALSLVLSLFLSFGSL